MISWADGDAFGIQEDEKRVEGGEAGGVGYCWTADERREEEFETGGAVVGFAGVDVVSIAFGGFRKIL